MAERLEEVKTLRPPHRHYKPSEGVGQQLTKRQAIQKACSAPHRHGRAES
jgi:hypothetical protein